MVDWSCQDVLPWEKRQWEGQNLKGHPQEKQLERVQNASCSTNAKVRTNTDSFRKLSRVFSNFDRTA